VKSVDSNGMQTFSAAPAGANLFGTGNAEYRVPIAKGFEAAGFFDLGSGWMLPNWLGSARPDLISATNGLLRGSTGIELRYTIPGIQVPVRTYYAVNLLRLNRSFLVPGSRSVLLRNRRSAFGWALGALF
jgi:outer membrane protein assembly factor BamA